MPIGEAPKAAPRGPRPLALLALLPLMGGCVLISEDELAWRTAENAPDQSDDGLTDGDDGSDGDDTTDDCGGADPATFYTDADGDGLGDPGAFAWACEAPAGMVDNADDCDDTDASIGPIQTWYLDGDGDGFGGGVGLEDCTRPAGYLADSSDCDDADPDRSPAAAEVCDGIDNDCNSLVDDDDAGLDLATARDFYADSDGDGAGDPAVATTACALPADHAETADDCDDSEPLAAPGLTEICGDGIDNDCSGEASVCLLSGTLPLSSSGITFASTLSFASTGSTVVGGRDLTGDGISDLLVTATSADRGAGTNSGELYLVPGDAGVGVGTVDLALSASTVIQGDAAGDLFASRVALADDLDGDGVDDLLAGTGYADLAATDAGAVYLFSGALSSGTHAASDAASAVVTGTDPGDFVGFSFAPLGDVDADGIGDLAVGAYKRGTNSAGAVYLLHGPITGTRSTASASLTVEGEPVDRVGYSVAEGADLTGDGVADLVFGADRASTALILRAGAVGVVSGDLTGTVAFADADAIVSGSAQDAGTGNQIELVGDVDNDGYEDILIGAPGELGGDGMAWLVAGPLSGATDTTQAIASFAGDSGDELGKSLASLPDVTGDGLPEVALGARGTGLVRVYHSPLVGSHTSATTDVALVGAATSKAGASVDGGGDFNGDGVPDIFIGQPGANAASVIFGGAQ